MRLLPALAVPACAPAGLKATKNLCAAILVWVHARFLVESPAVKEPAFVRFASAFPEPPEFRGFGARGSGAQDFRELSLEFPVPEGGKKSGRKFGQGLGWASRRSGLGPGAPGFAVRELPRRNRVRARSRLAVRTRPRRNFAAEIFSRNVHAGAGPRAGPNPENRPARLQKISARSGKRGRG